MDIIISYAATLTGLSLADTSSFRIEIRVGYSKLRSRGEIKPLSANHTLSVSG